MAGEMLGDYQILGEIGRGGMGIVYQARQVSLGRIVALKVLPPGLTQDPTAAVRFTREAQSMAALSHPNIVQVFEVGEQNGLRYFSMQYVEGESLQARITREGALPPEHVAYWGAQIADALAHAHDRGVVHRDIKPANVLIDAGGRAVVTDFGIAKTADGTTLTNTGMSMGTLEYMSPELIRGNPVDWRTDIYSLGVVLYQMVTGRLPFSATTPIAVAMKHVNEAPEPPRSFGSGCPEWLETVILKALAKEPVDRFLSAGEMATALRAAAPVARAVASPVAAAAPVPVAAPGVLGRPAGRKGSRLLPVLGVLVGVIGLVLILAASAQWYVRTQPGSTSGLGAVAGMLTGGSQGSSAPAAAAQPGIALAKERVRGAPPTGGSPAGPMPGGAAGGVTVPKVVGMDSGQARKAIETAGLRVEVRDQRPDASVGQGHVLGQAPTDGTTSVAGQTVFIDLSTGPPGVIVPNTVGMSLDEAKRAIEAAGLAAQLKDRGYDSDVPEGRVRSQWPAAGERAPRGDLVYLVASLGPPPQRQPSGGGGGRSTGGGTRGARCGSGKCSNCHRS